MSGVSEFSEPNKLVILTVHSKVRDSFSGPSLSRTSRLRRVSRSESVRASVCVNTRTSRSVSVRVSGLSSHETRRSAHY
jgi:hypothetical protein